jgi:hypothetical protein
MALEKIMDRRCALQVGSLTENLDKAQAVQLWFFPERRCRVFTLDKDTATTRFFLPLSFGFRARLHSGGTTSRFRLSVV